MLKFQLDTVHSHLDSNCLHFHFIFINYTAASFPQCKVGDDKCLAQFITHTIQHSEGKLNEFTPLSLLGLVCVYLLSECPEVGFPKLSPFELDAPFMLKSMQLTSLFTAEVYWTNIKTFGTDKAVIQEYR